jgi:hopene-associated glycosyltransferase HpnB
MREFGYAARRRIAPARRRPCRYEDHDLLALLALCIWGYLFFLHGRFWLSAPELTACVPSTAPAVDIIVPARDEAETIGPVVASLLAQQYAGRARVIVVDDGSADGTADLARRADRGGTAAPLEVIAGRQKPPGWSGKLWAVSQGIDASDAPLVLLTDADIVHGPRHLATLVARLEADGLDLVSEMVRLNCQSLAERWLVPAFVYFFQMLYPFSRVNDPRSRTAAAAGGSVLIRRRALDRIGGIASIRGALIDDVTLAQAVKRGGAIYLGHSGLATSIRRYPQFSDIWQMIARTAFTQLHHSATLLVLTVSGLILVWWVPVAAALFGQGGSRLCGMLAFCLSVVSYWPSLTRYRCSRAWSLSLPLIALFYLAATVGSAVSHWRGLGARWKNRDYGGG